MYIVFFSYTILSIGRDFVRKIAYPAAKLFEEYPERIDALTHYLWAKKIFKECNISKLTIGIGTAFYPYHFMDEYKRPHGYEIDLCEIMKQYFEVDIEYKLHSNGLMEMFDSLQCNKADIIISSVSVSAERKRFVNFSAPYFENYLGLAVNGQYKNVQNLNELNKPDVKIAVTLGSTAEIPALRNFYRANIVKCANTSALEKRLLEEKVDAVISDANWINFAQRRNPNEIHVLAKEIPGTSELTSMAVAKDKSLLMTAISMFLLQYNDSPVRAKIYQKWFGEAEAR